MTQEPIENKKELNLFLICLNKKVAFHNAT